MNHYEEAVRNMERPPVPPPDIPAHSDTAVENRRRDEERRLQLAHTHALLYLAEQMEVLGGVIAESTEKLRQRLLTREELGG